VCGGGWFKWGGCGVITRVWGFLKIFWVVWARANKKYTTNNTTAF
jgi:hypothetical protein